jgi:anti-anti-sigma factor
MVQYITSDDDLTCRFSGKLDTFASQNIEKELYEKIEEHPGKIIFDLEDVNFVCSTFFRLCLKVFKTVGGERFSIVEVSPEIKKVFKIAGFDQQMSIE